MANSDIGIITTLHGTDVTILGHDPGLRNTVRYGINKSTITTAVSESLRQETLELIEPEKEFVTIYNFIDENKYRPGRSRDIEKRSWDSEPDEKVIIHISNFRKVKRIPDIIESFKMVRKELDAKLLLVGDGPEKMDMEELVAELGLQNDVIFTGKEMTYPNFLPSVMSCFICRKKRHLVLFCLKHLLAVFHQLQQISVEFRK